MPSACKQSEALDKSIQGRARNPEWAPRSFGGAPSPPRLPAVELTGHRPARPLLLGITVLGCGVPLLDHFRRFLTHAGRYSFFLTFGHATVYRHLPPLDVDFSNGTARANRWDWWGEPAGVISAVCSPWRNGRR